MSAPHHDAPAGVRPTEATLAIDGMTCGACAARIERRLNQLEGVHASVSYASESAFVEMESDDRLSAVVEAIESLGYGTRTALPDSVADDLGGADAAVRSLGRRLIVAGLLFMPLCDMSLLFWLMPDARFPGWQWFLTITAAPVVTWCAWPFYTAAARHLRRGTFSMDSLVSLGILVSTAWSLYTMFWQRGAVEQHTFLYSLTHHTGGAIYIDVAAGVTTFLLAGRFFEAWTKRRTRNSLRSLAAVAAQWVDVVDTEGDVHRLPVSALVVGQQFVVRPGDTVATDGQVVSGRASLDRSAMTGESLPVDVGPGDAVIGGTVSVDGRLIVRAEKVGHDTQLAQMVQLVERAQSEKASVQRLADRIAGIFVPAVLLISACTLSAWLASGAGANQALNASLSVLIIACPCALGLATPMALMVASGQGARLGIFFKGYQGIEASRQVDTVILDKTGTVTTGAMTVTELCTVPGVSRRELLAWAGAVEHASEHLVARAIVTAALDGGTTLEEVEDFTALPGLGARGMVGGHRVVVGRPGSWPAPDIPAEVNEARVTWEARGQTVVLVACDDEVLGAIALSDTVRPTAAAAVADLHALGLHCILLTGDNRWVAETVAAAAGIDEVVAEALPADKVDLIRRLQAAGRSVAMVGDGINDGPAIASADLGLAVGSGTDVARDAADLIVVRDDLRVVPVAIDLARGTLHTIRGNLGWAFAYNVAAIPLAALGLLNPLIAGATMALSSAFVVWNSARIGRRLERPDLVPSGAPHPAEEDRPATMTPSSLPA
ncbi:MAG TPA: cation-translocating P-type ATPase [Acidimicrobiales bacterium]|nr:cation-translocating P-type ATPase [Acidimicrobiales bacterium]